MNKKMLLLIPAAMSALLALPAFASALPAHLNENPGNFTVHGGAGTWSRTDGNSKTSTTTVGVGAFENTTTGTVELTFSGVTSALGPCNSAGQVSGTVKTTKLPFHLVMLLSGKPGVLVTPGKDLRGASHFATHSCFFGAINVVVRGSGILGEITSPACGIKSNTATLKFNGAAGIQTPNTYTGTTYKLQSSLNGGALTDSAINAEAKITFAASKTPSLVCT